MTTNNGLVSTKSLTEYPIDIISSIAVHLDLCSLWNLVDTCQFFRYHLLAIQEVWRRIVIDIKFCNHSQLYAGLRRFRDSNGLRSLVQQVILDGNDDANISWIIMLVKFPQLRHLSARYRRFSTNIETDTRLLQELYKGGTLKPHSIPLERVDMYHYYFTSEPHLEAFQRTLDRISKVPVQLDIRLCSMVPKEERQQQQQQSQNPLVIMEQTMEEMTISSSNECQNIIAKEAYCWACLYPFEGCWKCEPICNGCQKRRLPPLANDQKLQDLQRQQKQQERQKFINMKKEGSLIVLENNKQQCDNLIDDPSLEDEFSVFD
ncbi:hypothetical protein INT45_002872 [Circinella minor]|uniref:F-box domain-containing protein n=1 Tax=Circinella minor TaxID=1195481 RepID=A0A8H7S7W5_9FUNG|nr:hypothetical protein INT45_002872 [Circinella minor]